MATSDRVAQEIRSRLEEFCSQRGYVLNPASTPLIDDLAKMHRQHGDFYCPCQPTRAPETVCVCSAAKNGLVELEGACFCGLVLLPEKSSEG